MHNQLVYVEGTAAPSAIASVIQSTGRDAVLRGSGNSNGAGVCILETHSTAVPDKVRGLVRMVQVSPSMTLVDLAIRGLTPGKYWVTVRQSGDISEGAASTGRIWEAADEKSGSTAQARGELGTVEVGQDCLGSMFFDKAVHIWEVIGRTIVVSRERDGEFKKDDANTLVGVIARSAGV